MPKHLDSSDSIRSDLKVVIQPSLPLRQGRNNAIPFCVFFVKKNVHHFAIFAKDSLIDRAKVGIKSDKAAPLVINFVKRCDKKMTIFLPPFSVTFKTSMPFIIIYNQRKIDCIFRESITLQYSRNHILFEPAFRGITSKHLVKSHFIHLKISANLQFCDPTFFRVIFPKLFTVDSLCNLQKTIHHGIRS